MTRRERHLKIIGSFGDRDQRYHENVLRSRYGLDVFTDDAIEKLASDMVRTERRRREINAENRRLRDQRAVLR